MAVKASEVLVTKKNPKTTARNAPGSAAAIRSGHFRRGFVGGAADVVALDRVSLAMVTYPSMTNRKSSERASMVEVGDIARRTRTVRAEDIALFTELTGYRNPLHYGHTAVLDGSALVWQELLSFSFSG